MKGKKKMSLAKGQAEFQFGFVSVKELLIKLHP